ncbi:MAG: V-type ATP synthase subunit A [Epulopiscium sp.]|jgi:V/A-type H+-transporting ATPase subunit A|nr:V-type ATP synthase subunit A [Candidatus Epulonipiscium sp.]
MHKEGIVTFINGPVVKAENMSFFKVREMVTIGKQRLIGEVISINNNEATIQVYEETEGLKTGEIVSSTGNPLSVKLAPGMIGNMFDGIQRPLKTIEELSPNFIPEGIGLISLDEEKKWDVNILVEEGQYLNQGQIFAEVPESLVIKHKIMVPLGIEGKVIFKKENGKYSIKEVLIKLEDKYGKVHDLNMIQEWPVRTPRPVSKRMAIKELLVTGQRVLDIFFPIAKGGTAAVPGGFGTGKTVIQHQLAKWSNADIIIYIGCGERGNEMTAVLEEFPKLIDPRSKRPIMERTILIANTSNMPVAAREASIYTGITMAEYYRDMGYDVAIMADSTSRWAEALREISGRLEEMPAEEGYPAYLPSRLAEFYERAGLAKSLTGELGSITIIGAVSPPGGDFSEPVTESTKRFVNAFLALDKSLAYARHYPAINYLISYSGYANMLAKWYQENVGEDILELRTKLLSILQEENKLMEIVQLVGEDVLPNDQRLILEIAKVIKIGFLQQNALHMTDSFVSLQKQYKMIKTIYHLYERAHKCIKLGIPISQVKDEKLYNEIIKIKYTVENNKIELIDKVIEDIDLYFDELEEKYKQ